MAVAQYKIADGKITRKVQYAAGSGLGTIAGAAIILTYLVNRLDPTIPDYVVGAIVSLVTGFAVWFGTVGVAYMTRPSKRDQPIIDRAVSPPRIVGSGSTLDDGPLP